MKIGIMKILTATQLHIHDLFVIFIILKSKTVLNILFVKVKMQHTYYLFLEFYCLFEAILSF